LAGASARVFEELVTSGLIYKERNAELESYRFKHALVQDAIYGSLLVSDRRRLHGAVGCLFEELYADRLREIAEELATHFEVAEDEQKAARYAFMAGDKAYALFALADAESWFGKAIATLSKQRGHDVDRFYAKAIVNQVPVICFEARFREMLDLAESSLPRIKSMGETPELAMALVWLSEAYLNLWRWEESERTLQQALEVAEKLNDSRLVGYVLGEFAWLHSITSDGEPDDHLEKLCARTEAIAREQGDHYVMTLAHYGRWADSMHRGRMARAIAQAELLISYGTRTGYPPALCWGSCMLAHALICEDKLETAQSIVDFAQQNAQCRNDLLLTDSTRGVLLAAQGEPEGASEYLGHSMRLGDEVGSLYFAYFGDVVYGRVLAAQGRHRDALSWLTEGLAFFRENGHRRAEAMAALALGELDQERAPDYLKQSIALAKETGMQGIVGQAHLRLSQFAPPDDSASHVLAAQEAVAPLGWERLKRAVGAWVAAGKFK
jgi:tetratricopeptide (TPR) repeat protein